MSGAEQEPKEWLRVARTPVATTVTCTLVQGNLSVKWAVKTYESTIKLAVAEARKFANRALVELREAAEAD